MKRLLIGTLWCVLLWLGVNVALGAYAGATAGAQAQGLELGYAFSRLAGEALQDRDALLLSAAVVLSAVLGTLTGVLPGTKRRRKKKAG